MGKSNSYAGRPQRAANRMALSGAIGTWAKKQRTGAARDSFEIEALERRVLLSGVTHVTPAAAPAAPAKPTAAVSPNAVGSGTGFTVFGTEGGSTFGTLASFPYSFYNTGHTGHGTTGATPLTAFSATVNWGDGSTSTYPQGSGAFAFGSGNTGTTVTVTAGHTYAEEGTYTTTITLTANGASSDAQGSASVADAALFAANVQPTVTPAEGTAFSGAVARFVDTDPGGTASEYKATINWGDNTTSNATSISPSGNGGFNVLGGHTYAEGGSYTITVTVTDTEGQANPAGTRATVTVFNTANVTDKPLTKLNTAPSTLSGTEGTSINASAAHLAHFTDADAGAVAADYSVSIDWGDGLSSAGSIISDGSGGFYAVGGSHTYAENGNYTVTTTVTDVYNSASPGNTVTQTTSAAVADAALVMSANAYTLTATEGQASTSQLVAQFHDNNTFAPEPASDFVATVTFTEANGSTSTASGTVASIGGGDYTVAVSHTYLDENADFVGTKNITVEVHESGSAVSTGTVHTANGDVSEAAITLVTQGYSLSGTEGVTGTTAGATVATFSDSGGAEPIGDYAASIAWGDGATDTGTIVPLGGGSFSVTAPSHLYQHGGVFNPVVTITHETATSITATDTATIAEAALGSPVAASLGAASQISTLPQWNGSTSASPFGRATDGVTATYGQVITPTANQSTLNSFSFEINAPSTLSFNGEVYAWNGTSATGTSLFESPALHTAGSGNFELTTVNIPGGVSLTPGQQYVLFVSTSKLQAGHSGSASFGITADTAYPGAGNTFVYDNNTDSNGSGWTSGPPGWNNFGTIGVDLAFTANFSPTAVEGTSFTNVVGTFTDANPSAVATDFGGSIGWGDGTPPSSPLTAANFQLVSTSPSGSIWNVLGTHTYAVEENGVALPITVSVTDDNQSVTINSTATVADAPITTNLNTTPISVLAGKPTSFNLGSFSDPGAPYETEGKAAYRVTVDWGDGSQTILPTGSLGTSGPNTFTLNGIGHTYSATGQHSISVDVVDLDGGYDTGFVASQVVSVPLNNGSFDDGTFTGWNVSHTGSSSNPSILAGGAPGQGSFYAFLGNNNSDPVEPSGDSILTQNFTVPTGASVLSFWIKPNSTDLNFFDQQVVLIKNAAGTATLATVLNQASNSQTWTHVTFDLTPYVGQTIQLYFGVHQDGFGDPTGMGIDGVAIQ